MLGVIGGTGLYQLEDVTKIEVVTMSTPFGAPSSSIVRGKWGVNDVLFLARHGAGHKYLPHEINYRANIYALKSLGVTQIVGLSAVGSLREEIAPGDLALPVQYFDWTKGKREQTFFGHGISAHVSTAEPVSSALAGWIAEGAERMGIKLHRSVTYACVEGPRLGTRAESHFLRSVGCDIVGMTNLPEAFLAREAQICYASIGVVTDYDCWMEDPGKHVTATSIFEQYGASLSRAKALLGELLSAPLPPEESAIRNALSVSVLTPRDAISSEQAAWFSVLSR